MLTVKSDSMIYNDLYDLYFQKKWSVPLNYKKIVVKLREKNNYISRKNLLNFEKKSRENTLVTCSFHLVGQCYSVATVAEVGE